MVPSAHLPARQRAQMGDISHPRSLDIGAGDTHHECSVREGWDRVRWQYQGMNAQRHEGGSRCLSFRVLRVRHRMVAGRPSFLYTYGWEAWRHL